MKFLKNENGVSEIVGMMLILLIGVVFLGTLQAYEVPKWNKEIEMEQFYNAQDDIVTFRSNLEDVALLNIPRTAKIKMGARYPDRFMLRNPGPGAHGTIYTYPLDINISYSTDTGSIIWRNYTSMGIEYELFSILDLPKIVYENGLIIEDYGRGNISIDDEQTMITDDNVYIPILGGNLDSISSTSMETFSIVPVGTGDYEQQTFKSMNVTIETKYPDIWMNLSQNTDIPEGSNFSVNMASGTIRITDIPGFNVKPLKRPRPLSLPNITGVSNEIFSGIVMINEDPDTIITVIEDGGGGGSGVPMSDDDKLYDLPPSDNFTHFWITNITVEEGITGQRTMEFEVEDSKDNDWEVVIKFYWATDGTCSVTSGGSNLCADIQQQEPTGLTQNNVDINATRLIDLTAWYVNASIQQPNVLEIDKMNDDILYVVFDVV